MPDVEGRKADRIEGPSDRVIWVVFPRRGTVSLVVQLNLMARVELCQVVELTLTIARIRMMYSTVPGGTIQAGGWKAE